MLPHLQTGVIGLSEVTDLPALVAPLSGLQLPGSATLPAQAQRMAEPPLIACVDDSLWMCQTLEQTVTRAGYQFMGISEVIRAIPQLLAKKPQLILLDLRMPMTNGYEICSQLRRLSTFKDTPIIILTGNDGIIDRARARLVGATDFLSKSISQELLLAALEQYLGANNLA